MDLEKYYEIIKGLMPYANYFVSSNNSLSNKIKNFQKIISTIDEFGGVKLLSNLMNLNKDTNQSQVDINFIHKNNLPLINTLPKIKNLD